MSTVNKIRIGQTVYDIEVEAANVNGAVKEAVVASKMKSTNVGSDIQPIYIDEDGDPVATLYKLETDVPSDAIFKYNIATQSANGLMSAADKVKLDNVYKNLPIANGSTLGAVKTNSSITSNEGYTACPIIKGIPYYKTDSIYNLEGDGIVTGLEKDSDAYNLVTSGGNVRIALYEDFETVKKSVADGKTELADAISNNGVQADSDLTFSQLAGLISDVARTNYDDGYSEGISDNIKVFSRTYNIVMSGSSDNKVINPFENVSTSHSLYENYIITLEMIGEDRSEKTYISVGQTQASATATNLDASTICTIKLLDVNSIKDGITLTYRKTVGTSQNLVSKCTVITWKNKAIVSGREEDLSFG